MERWNGGFYSLISVEKKREIPFMQSNRCESRQDGRPNPQSAGGLEVVYART